MTKLCQLISVEISQEKCIYIKQTPGVPKFLPPQCLMTNGKRVDEFCIFNKALCKCAADFSNLLKWHLKLYSESSFTSYLIL